MHENIDCYFFKEGFEGCSYTILLLPLKWSQPSGKLEERCAMFSSTVRRGLTSLKKDVTYSLGHTDSEASEDV